MTRLFLKFLTVGAVATLVHYSALILLVEAFNARPVVASALGFAIGAVANYALNYRFTYKSSLPHSTAFPKFATTAGLGLAVNTATMAVCNEWLGLYYLASQIVATGVTLVWNFVLNTFWSFRPDERIDS